MSCEHRSPGIELREERTIIVCESCRTELVGWSFEISLPFFLLGSEEKDRARYGLSRNPSERGQEAGAR